MNRFSDAFDGKWEKLIKCVDVSHGLLDCLRDWRVLQDEHYAQIMTQTTEYDRVRALLDKLQRRSDDDFHKFIDALRRTGQEDIVKILQGNCGEELACRAEPLVCSNDTSQELAPSPAMFSLSDSGVPSSFMSQIGQHPACSKTVEAHTESQPLLYEECAINHLRRMSGDKAKFREGQLEIVMELVKDQKKKLLVQASGWGKTFVFLAATHCIRQDSRKMTLVVTPLVALARNQQQSAASSGLHAVVVDMSTRESREWPLIRSEIRRGQTDVIIITPEQLKSKLFQQPRIPKQIGLLVVDEAQCISEWANDFRPDYRRLKHLIHQLDPKVPILATTATAPKDIEKDITELLTITEPVQRGRLARDSLRIDAVELDCRYGEAMAWIAERLSSSPLVNSSGIIYCLTIAYTELVAGWLRHKGVPARAYYANVMPPYGVADGNNFKDSNAYRKWLEEMFSRNEIRVLVATTALGMGYDKPDVKFVILYEAPISPSTIYQQIGRAARGDEIGYGIIIYDSDHCWLQTNILVTKPLFDNEDLVKVGEIFSLADRRSFRGTGMTISDIERHYNQKRSTIEHALRYMSVSNCVRSVTLRKKGNKGVPETLWIRNNEVPIADYTEISKVQLKRKSADWEKVKDICEFANNECLSKALCEAVGDTLGDYQCRFCSRCTKHHLLDICFERTLKSEAQEYLESYEKPHLRLNLKIPADAFRLDKFTSKELKRARTGRIMSYWMDGGWGSVVSQGYYSEHKDICDEELIKAVAELVGKWSPLPGFTWMTCIPSNTHSTLMPRFLKDLSKKLKIPFKRAIKINPEKSIGSKREQLNAFHQCANLDGAYFVDKRKVDKGPVLLVDYLVRSGWTMTVAAALLSRAGSGPVFPLALSKMFSEDNKGS